MCDVDEMGGLYVNGFHSAKCPLILPQCCMQPNFLGCYTVTSNNNKNNNKLMMVSTSITLFAPGRAPLIWGSLSMLPT